MNNAKKKPSEILFEKYSWLAGKYAGRIYSYENISYEYEDLLQEFRIKIYTSIKAYGRRYLKYRRGEARKPVPLRYYLEAACGNKMRDFTREITRESGKLRMDAVRYDYGIEQDTEISPEENRFTLHGVDLLEGLTGKERVVFSLYLRGYNIAFINKVYFNKSEQRQRREVVESGDEPFTATDVIELQRNRIIRKYGSDLRTASRVYATMSYEDE